MQPDFSRSLSRRGALAAGFVSLLGARALAQPNGAAPATNPKPSAPEPSKQAGPLFTISLAQWSLHRTLRAGTLDHLDFPKFTREQFGIDAVEYVNSFFKEKSSSSYNAELRKRCDAEGVKSVLIMCDGEGALGDKDEAKRLKAVDNHMKWLEAAKALGCHSIRVNAQSEGSFEEQQKLAADGLRRLCERGETFGLNVIVENHWGLSSNGRWLAGVMKLVNHPRVGTLPDFGNFDPKEYDRYDGVKDLMPFAKGVSAKSYEFDERGFETKLDYPRMMKIVLDAGYRARVGIEFEGSAHPEAEGIRKTKALLEKLREELAPTYAGA